MTLTDDGLTSLSPEGAFAILGNETRFDIVYALWDLYDPDDPANIVKFSALYDAGAAIPFSELYDSVGYDDTGNFSYHLEKLTDHFVRRTDAGYELTEAGFEVVRAVIAGTVSERPHVDTATIDVDCPRCGAPVEVGYANHHLAASCSACPGLWHDATGKDGVLFTLPLPPRGLSDRSPNDAFHATLSYNFNRIRSFIDGVCPDCSGTVSETLDVCRTHEPRDGGGCPQCHRQHRIEVAERCRQCKAVSRGPLSIAILAHPAVTAFFYDRGIEHRFASWGSFLRAQTVETDLRGTDPLRIALTIPAEGDELQLTLDEGLEVVDATSSPA